MRNRMVMAALVALVAGGVLAAVPASAGDAGKVREYVVRYEDGVSTAEGQAAIRSLGGRVVDELDEIGVAKVQTSNADFEAGVLASAELAGATINRVIGYAEPALREKVDDVESLIEADGVGQQVEAEADEEPLAGLQWDMQMINATADESYSVATGNHDVGRGNHRYRHRRLPPRPGAELQHRSQSELHDRHRVDRRPLQSGARSVL